MIQYFRSYKDTKGYTYSIDNCVVTYFLKCSINYCIDFLRELKDVSGNYYEKLNCPACTRYQFFQSHFHVENGIYIQVGKYDMYLEEEKRHELLPCMKLEVNLNKHHDKVVMDKVRDFIADYCTDGELKRYDFAVDVPERLADVKILKSRKEKGLYKGTIYRGQRNKHGFMKIYDKQIESGLPSPMTRIEYSFVSEKKLTFEEVFVMRQADQEVQLADLDVRPSIKSFVKMVSILNMLGYDTEEYMETLNYRTRLKVEPFVTGHLEKIEYELELLEKLLQEIKYFLYIDDIPKIVIDEDGFMQLNGDFDLFD